MLTGSKKAKQCFDDGGDNDDGDKADIRIGCVNPTAQDQRQSEVSISHSCNSVIQSMENDFLSLNPMRAPRL